MEICLIILAALLKVTVYHELLVMSSCLLASFQLAPPSPYRPDYLLKPPLFPAEALKGSLTILICFPAAADLLAPHLPQHRRSHGFINAESCAAAGLARPGPAGTSIHTRSWGFQLASQRRKKKSLSIYPSICHPSIHQSIHPTNQKHSPKQKQTGPPSPGRR